MLDGLAGTTQRAEAEIARLERTRDDLQSSTSAREAALDAGRSSRPTTLAILAGLVPVTGPGIRITITEADGPVDVDTLLDTVQELRTAGAEAIQINERGPGRRADARSRTPSAASRSTAQLVELAVRPRRHRRPARRCAAALDFPTGPRDQLEDATARRSTSTSSQSIDIESRRHAAASLSTPSPTPAQ